MWFPDGTRTGAAEHSDIFVQPLVSSSLTDLGALHEKETDQHSFVLTFLTHPHKHTHYAAHTDTHRALAH